MNSFLLLFIASASFLGTMVSIALSFQYQSWLPYVAYLGMWGIVAFLADRDQQRRVRLRYKLREVKPAIES